MPNLVLTLDPQYDDDGEVERAVGGDRVTCRALRLPLDRPPPAELLGSCDGLLVWQELAVDADLIANLTRCRIVVRAGVGTDNIDLAAAGAAGIPVCNTPDYGTGEVADHAIALILALERGLVGYDAAIRRDPVGGFDHRVVATGRRLRGRRLGLVGLGRIGTATALRAKAFGLEVLTYDPYLPRGQEIAVGVQRCETLEALLGGADIVSLHTPLTEETRFMIDAERLAAMRPGAILVNTARGEIVDPDALRAALRSGHLRAAGLDVLPQEPPVPVPQILEDHRTGADWLRDRLILTPHAAWKSVESCQDARRLSAETVARFLTGGALRNCVNAALIDADRRAARVPGS